MDTPEDERKAEELRRAAVESARALLEKNPEFPKAVVQAHDADGEVRRNRPEEAKERLSTPRLEYLLRALDVHGEAYLPLVTDLESAKAFATIMDGFARAMWFQFSGLTAEEIPPIMPFVDPQPIQIQRSRIFERARHWVVEGYRHLDSLRADPPKSTNTKDKSPRKLLEPRPDLLTDLDASVNRLKAAQILGITPRTLDRWISDGRLTPVGPGQHKRFRNRELKKVLDQKKLDNRDKK